MNNLINTSYGDFWTAVLISILLFVVPIIVILIRTRQSVRENIDVVFRNNNIEQWNKDHGEQL
jgi:hypothetical protein